MGGSSTKELPKEKGDSSSGKISSISTSDKVKLQLKMQRDSLRATLKKYERVRELEREKAKELLKAGDKRKALYCLKREKIQGNRITQLTTMYDNIDKLLGTIEVKEVEVQVFESLKSGQQELKKLNSILNIDDIEKLMAETEESLEQAQEINNVLSQPINNVLLDEDDLLRELIGETDESFNILEKYKVPYSKPVVRESEKNMEEKFLEAA